MSKVALVFPYFRTHAPGEILFPPLGLASLASQLRTRGIETKIFDCTFTTPEQVHRSLVSYSPDVVGIYCMITQSRNTFRMVEGLRADLPGSLMVTGGPLPTLYPERFSRAFDVIFRGEADLSFPRFCLDYFNQQISRERLVELPLETYEGLFIRNAELQVDNATVHYSEKIIQSFPLPDRSDFDHAAYQREWLHGKGIKTTSLMITLGCPFDCDFCSRPIYGNRYRRRSLEAVFEEIEQIRTFGYDSIWIADDNFTLNLAFLAEFCQQMAGRGMNWSCLSRSTGINREVAEMMKSSGCQRVYLGLETGSDATLQLMNKRATLEDGIKAVHQFSQAGVQVAAFFIVGYPGETTASIESTFQLALDLPLDEISFNVPFPLPGSKLFDRVSGVDPNKDWDKENEVTFVYNTEFDSNWLRGRIEQTMAAFAEKRRNPNAIG